MLMSNDKFPLYKCSYRNFLYLLLCKSSCFVFIYFYMGQSKGEVTIIKKSLPGDAPETVPNFDALLLPKTQEIIITIITSSYSKYVEKEEKTSNTT